MGYYSVIEAITKIVAMGGSYQNVRLSLQEYFPKLTTPKS
jgi:phosphoribosylformylglycinamidine synthase